VGTPYKIEKIAHFISQGGAWMWGSAQKRQYFDSRLQQEVLIRAVVEEPQDERVVTTVYISSKIGKYMKGAKP
jgi:hypothetical protein